MTPTKCAQMHLDVWSVHADWLQSQIRALKIGALMPKPERSEKPIDGSGYTVSQRLALIPIDGPMMKGWSKYGGTSTMWARNAIRLADKNNDVDAIMLHIESPGGTVAGTAELADDVRRTKKPIHAHIDDLGASAAYWVASQADRISVNRTGFVGSIGAYAAIYDESGAAEQQGIKVHVISTGPYKGAGEPGAEVTEEHLAHWQEIVDKHFEHFETAVRSGRRLLKAQFKRVADGRIFDAKDAQQKGLVDSVESFDLAMLRLRRAATSK